MTSAFAMEAFALEKSYGATWAVRGVTFCVAPGQVTAFVGQNGAGKSSTLRMLLGFAAPTNGTARVLGEPIGSLTARSRIALRGQNKPLYRYMTVAQIIRFTKSFYSDWDEEAERRLLDEYQLPLERRLETRARFLFCLVGATAICGPFTIRAQALADTLGTLPVSTSMRISTWCGCQRDVERGTAVDVGARGGTAGVLTSIDTGSLRLARCRCLWSRRWTRRARSSARYAGQRRGRRYGRATRRL